MDGGRVGGLEWMEGFGEVRRAVEDASVLGMGEWGRGVDEGTVQIFFFFFSSRRRHTRFDCDWSSDVCSSDLTLLPSSSTSTPRTMKPLEEYFCCISISQGISIWHGSHHVAQKFTSTTLPLYSLSGTSLPSRLSKVTSGSGVPNATASA